MAADAVAGDEAQLVAGQHRREQRRTHHAAQRRHRVAHEVAEGLARGEGAVEVEQGEVHAASVSKRWHRRFVGAIRSAMHE